MLMLNSNAIFPSRPSGGKGVWSQITETLNATALHTWKIVTCLGILGLASGLGPGQPS